MTREEAINYLSPIAKSARPSDYKAALGMALDALRAQQTPAKLDRSRWEGCCYCKDSNLRMMYFLQSKKYCSGCGKPLTKEAWVELERRINGGKS